MDKTRNSNRLRIAGALVGALAFVTTVSAIAAASQESGDELPPVSHTELPPPSYNRWIRPDTGRIEAYVWDDRPISAAQKAEDPRYDPRWKPFSDCMVAEGFDIRSDPAKPFSQKDLDALVEQANRELPDPGLNRTIGSDIAEIQGYAGAFLRCGYWLALRPDEWAPHGIERLGPGESPEP